MAAYVTYTQFLILLTLLWSAKSFADHCQQENWDVLLNKHLLAENWYNVHTRQFNQLLENYNDQVFISKEFDEHELITLWEPHKDIFHRQLHQQIENSHHLSNLLLHQSNLSSQKMDSISGLTLAWKRISIHCKKQGSSENYQASLHYINTSQSLLSDLKKLSVQYHSLSQQYLNEAKLIEQSKSHYHQKYPHRN